MRFTHILGAHTRPAILAAAVGLGSLLAVAKPAAAQFVSLPFAYNSSNQKLVSSFPTGNVSMVGIPFAIPTGMNQWSGDVAAGGGSGNVSTTIPVNLAHVPFVYTLINTEWGMSILQYPNAYASLTFNYTDGTTDTVNLYGDQDIRDYQNWIYTNLVNNTSTNTVVAINYPEYRMDMQAVDLTPNMGKTLGSITVNDMGAPGYQRLYVNGITAYTGNWLSSMTPTQVTAGQSVVLHLTGAGFQWGSVIQVGSYTLQPTTDFPTSISVTVPAADTQVGGTVMVSVVNPDGAVSNAIPLNIVGGTGGSPSLALSGKSMSYDATNSRYVLKISFKNSGTATALGAEITTATLNGVAATDLPASLGNIAPGATGHTVLYFPMAQATGTYVPFDIQGSYSGAGTFGKTGKWKLP